MKLCSITVTSDTKEAIVADALRSVGFCDLHLIVHMATPDDPYDDTLAIAKSVAGEKYRQVDLELLGFDSIDKFRNFGLAEAHSLGADWAIQMDTDDRLLLNGLDLRKYLEDLPPEVHSLAVYTDDGEGDRTIIFRLPAQGKFVGKIHEDYSMDSPWLCPDVRMHSLPKSPEVLRARLTVDAEGLIAQCKDDPTNPRWPYFLGVSYEQLGRPLEAQVAYLESAYVSEDRGMAAWCYFRAAYCGAEPDVVNSLALCAEGMAQFPAMPELQVMASHLCLALSRPVDAEAWAKMALAHTWTKRFPEVPRLGPKSPAAHFHAPFEALAAAYAAQKNYSAAAWAEAEGKKAEAQCEKFCKTGTI